MNEYELKQELKSINFRLQSFGECFEEQLDEVITLLKSINLKLGKDDGKKRGNKNKNI